MSDTPRTDALMLTIKSIGGEYPPASAMTAVEFARKLERERNELRTVLDRCHHAMGESEHSDDESLPEGIELFVREHRQRINELERQRDELLKALEKLLAEKPGDRGISEASAAIKKARA